MVTIESSCDAFGLVNLVKLICTEKQQHPELTTQYFAKKYQCSLPTIRTYLRKGTRLGWCNYDAALEKEQHIKRSGRPLHAFKDGVWYGNFESCAAFARAIQSEFNITSSIGTIRNALRQKQRFQNFDIIAQEEKNA